MFGQQTTYETLMDRMERPAFVCTAEEARELLAFARERVAAKKEKSQAEELERLADELGYDLLPKART